MSEPEPKPTAGRTRSRSLVVERIFDAPVERVWRAWTEPEAVMKWWGPEGFTSPSSSIDFRVGGKYLFCMQDPDGNRYYSTGSYREIVPSRKIVATDSFADEKGEIVPASHYGLAGEYPLELIVTITFEALPDGRTKLTLRHEGLPAGEESDAAADGWRQSFDKLAESMR